MNGLPIFNQQYNILYSENIIKNLFPYFINDKNSILELITANSHFIIYLLKFHNIFQYIKFQFLGQTIVILKHY